MIVRAVLMAGGEGLRMRPLTTNIPKPLLPVVGRPLMAHTLERLRDSGISDIVVTVHYLAGQIRDYFGDGSDFGVDLSYSTETRPLGTAGSVKAAAAALAGEPFLVLSGDAIADVDLADVARRHEESGAALTMVLTPRDDPREFGVAVLGEDDRVVALVEKPGWGDVLSDRVNTGIYCVSPHVLDRIPDNTPSDWARDVIPELLAAGEPVMGYVTEGYWEDVGSLAAYLAVQRHVLEGRAGPIRGAFEVRPGVWLAEGAEVDQAVSLVPPVFIGPFARISAGAQVGPATVIGANTVVRRSARIDHSVILEGCRVDEGAELRGAIVGRDTQVLRGSRVDDGAVVADDCVLGEESVVAADVRVFPGKSIDAGAVVRESVVWESKSRKHVLGPGGMSGLVNVDLSVDRAVRLASALASTLPKASVVTVGRDHSRAARAFNRAITGSLTAAGMNVRDLRTAAVPIVRADTANNSAAGVVLRTTPGRPDSLDIMLLDSRGTDVSSAVRRSVERAFVTNEFRRPAPADFGDVEVPHRVAEDYANNVLAAVSVEGVAAAALRVVVDTGGGAAALVLPTVLGRVGVDVLAVNNWLAESRPTDTGDDRAKALTSLAGLVATSRADFGVRFDPAGERLSLIDETGRIVPDDRAALIVADLVCAETHGSVALPITTTRVAERVTRFHGSRVLWTPVGERALSAGMGAADVVLGADGEGGFIVPGVGRHLDPFAAFVRLLGLVARTRLTVSAIDARIPQSYVVTTGIVTPWAFKAAVMRSVRDQARTLTVEDGYGGIRIVCGGDRWVFVTADPTEAVTHVWAEGVDADDAEELLDEWAERIRTALP
ncbi:MAG: sugar phosphate nucleotidyltransferase [Candidatus Nanopelagicales bacterium]